MRTRKWGVAMDGTKPKHRRAVPPRNVWHLMLTPKLRGPATVLMPTSQWVGIWLARRQHAEDEVRHVCGSHGRYRPVLEDSVHVGGKYALGRSRSRCILWHEGDVHAFSPRTHHRESTTLAERHVAGSAATIVSARSQSDRHACVNQHGQGPDGGSGHARGDTSHPAAPHAASTPAVAATNTA